MKLKVGVLSAAAGLVFVSSQAQATVITGSQIFAATTPGATFSAAPGSFELKTKGCTIGSGCPYTGVGVSGTTAGEIDINESITGVFAAPTTLDYFQLMVLYEGPEFGDFQEIAEVTVNFSGGGSATAQLQTSFDGVGNGVSATWTGVFGSVLNISPALEAEAGVWKVSNPFGSAPIDSIVFTAVAGTCGSGDCDNQSDYSIESMGYTAVPEPGSLALLGGGLVALRAAVRRRRQR